MQGAQILRNEAYTLYAAVTKDAAQEASSDAAVGEFLRRHQCVAQAMQGSKARTTRPTARSSSRLILSALM